jgi:hypothetical protein
VCEVDYDTVDPLRRAWHREDFGDNDPTEYQQQAKAVLTLRGARTLAVFAGAEPIAFAGLDLGEDGAEIGGLYALPRTPGARPRHRPGPHRDRRPRGRASVDLRRRGESAQAALRPARVPARSHDGLFLRLDQTTD